MKLVLHLIFSACQELDFESLSNTLFAGLEVFFPFYKAPAHVCIALFLHRYVSMLSFAGRTGVSKADEKFGKLH